MQLAGRCVLLLSCFAWVCHTPNSVYSYARSQKQVEDSEVSQYGPLKTPSLQI